MHLYEKRIGREIKHNGCILDVYKDTVLLENNEEAIRDVVSHSGGVCVLPLTDDGCVLFVKQFRYPVQKATLEIPAGKLEAGEDHFSCGKRELAEETGYETGDYRYLGCLFPTPAYCTEVIHMYIAQKLTPLQGQKLDVDEFLDVVKIKFDKAVEMVMQNEIEDAKTQIAVLKAKLLNEIK